MPRQDITQILLDEIERGIAPPSPLVNGARILVRSAPGRLDVLGALGAETGGTLAHMALPARVAVAVQLSEQPIFRATSDRFLESADIHLEQGTNSPPDHALWTTPLTALFRIFTREFSKLTQNKKWRGVALRIRSAIPVQSGQGYTTALLSAMTVALCELHETKMEPLDQALLIQRAETEADASGEAAPRPPRTGSVLDALTSLLAQRGTMLRYSAQPYRLVGPVPVPPDLRVLALDTGVRSPHGRETLEELRLSGAMGLRIIDTIYTDLGQTHTPLHGYLANTSPLLYRQYFRTLLPRRLRGQDFLRTYGPLPEREGILDARRFYRVRTAVDHLLAENEHAEQFLQAMEELAEMPVWGEAEQAERRRTLQRAGRLALASHHSYRLRLEFSCEQADWLVDRLMEFGPERGIYGARMTATGGGGTVMALVDRGAAASDAVLEVMHGYRKIFGIALEVSEAGAVTAVGTLAGS